MPNSPTQCEGEHAELVAVARDYLDGMFYADESKLRRAFHPQSLQVGHYRWRLGYDPLDTFVKFVMGGRYQAGPKRGATAPVHSKRRRGVAALALPADQHALMLFSDPRPISEFRIHLRERCDTRSLLAGFDVRPYQMYVAH
jgi:hypothetical protein